MQQTPACPLYARAQFPPDRSQPERRLAWLPARFSLPISSYMFDYINLRLSLSLPWRVVLLSPEKHRKLSNQRVLRPAFLSESKEKFELAAYKLQISS